MEWFRRNGFIALLVCLSVFALWRGSSNPRESLKHESHVSSLYGWDTAFYYSWLRSVTLDFDVDFTNDIELCDTLPESQKVFAIERLRRTETGLISNKYPVGWAVFHLPWFLLGHGTVLILDDFDVDVRTDGYGKTYERFLYLGSVFYAGLSLWLTYLLLQRFFDVRSSVASTLIVWLSGFLIYYQLNQYGMAHNLAYLCLVSTFYWAFAIQEMPPLKRNWVMLGVSVGLLLITRYQAGVYLLLPFVIAAEEILSRRAPLKAAFVCLLPLAAIVSLQLLAWKALYGSWLVYSYEGEGFNWGDPAIVESLFDPFHGLIYWHPIFLLGMIGLIGFVRANKDWRLWLIPISFAAMVYVNAAWETWWFGASFGNRAYEGASLFICLGVAWLIQVSGEWRLAWRGVLNLFCLVLVIWNLLILEVSIFNWRSGLSLEEPITHAKFWDTIVDRFTPDEEE